MRYRFQRGVVFLACCSFLVVLEVFGWTTNTAQHNNHQCWRSSKTDFYQSPSILHASDMVPPADVMETGKGSTPSISDGSRTYTSLAGDYSIFISSEDDGVHRWSLFLIDHVVAGEDILADGARSMKALESSSQLSTPARMVKPVAILSCTWSTLTTASIDLSQNSTVDLDLIDLLQRILVQWSWALRMATDDTLYNVPCTISFVRQDQEPSQIDFSSDDGLEKLFASLVDISSSSNIEWVEMVTGSGQALGRVPRRLVHTFNLLHRGIGLFVSKDRPMIHSTTSEQKKDDFPSLYVHRRSATKRIFPALYDMFVGGVSLAGEPAELTARRELAEELGLARALDENEAWDAPILTCIVCTAYNRCIVTLFSYAMNTQTETVTWQEEEVDWGSFVPYPVVVVAADRSIQRFANNGKWPGTYPPIQSGYQASVPVDVEYENVDDWREWDFVPDGLLVWEAWLKFLEGSRNKGAEGTN